MNLPRCGAAVLVCALAVLTGCAVDSSPSGGASRSDLTTVAANPYEDQREDAVKALLARWADAVRTNDAVAIASVVDPDAPPAFLAAELARAANLADVPLDEWGYQLVDEPETPVPSAVAAPLDAADVWAPSVELRFAVSGPDAEPTSRPVSLLVAKRNEEWRIVSDGDIPGIDRTTWRGPWDFGPVDATSVSTAGGTSVVLGHPEQRELSERLARELPDAIDAVSDFYGTEWPRTALLFTSGSPEEFTATAGISGTAADVAAVTVSDSIAPGRPVTGQRVVFGPDAQNRLTAFTTASVLRHELTHVAARADTVDGSPTWILEGFADYSGYRGSGSEFTSVAPTLSEVVRTGGPPSVLPEDSDFTAGGLRATLAYESAWSVCAFVAEQSGEPALRSLYERLSTGPKSADDISDAVVASTGMSTAEFLQAWGAWVVRQSR